MDDRLRIASLMMSELMRCVDTGVIKDTDIQTAVEKSFRAADALIAEHERTRPFSQMTHVDAVKAHMSGIEGIQTTAQVREALLAGGVTTEAKNFHSVVYTNLKRLADHGEIQDLGDGCWAALRTPALSGILTEEDEGIEDDLVTWANVLEDEGLITVVGCARRAAEIIAQVRDREVQERGRATEEDRGIVDAPKCRNRDCVDGRVPVPCTDGDVDFTRCPDCTAQPTTTYPVTIDGVEYDWPADTPLTVSEVQDRLGIDIYGALVRDADAPLRVPITLGHGEALGQGARYLIETQGGDDE